MRVTLRVEDEVIASISRVATIDGRSVDSVIDEALRDYLAKNPPRPMPVRKAAPLPKA